MNRGPQEVFSARSTRHSSSPFLLSTATRKDWFSSSHCTKTPSPSHGGRRPTAGGATARRDRGCARPGAGKAARHSPADPNSRFRRGLLLGHGGGSEHLLAPNHRRRPGPSRNVDLPFNTLVRPPSGREV